METIHMLEILNLKIGVHSKNPNIIIKSYLDELEVSKIDILFDSSRDLLRSPEIVNEDNFGDQEEEEEQA